MLSFRPFLFIMKTVYSKIAKKTVIKINRALINKKMKHYDIFYYPFFPAFSRVYTHFQNYNQVSKLYYTINNIPVEIHMHKDIFKSIFFLLVVNESK